MAADAIPEAIHWEPLTGMHRPPTHANPVSVLLTLFSLFLLFGCTSKELKTVVLDSTKRAPTETLDIFTNAATPNRSFKAIGELSFEGGPYDPDDKAIALFVPEAKKMGAQAVIIEKHISRVTQHGDFGRTTFYLFKARVLVYE